MDSFKKGFVNFCLMALAGRLGMLQAFRKKL